MAFDPNHLLQRTLVIDRNRDIAFCHLKIVEATADLLLPLMLKLANVEDTQMTYLIPIDWVGDAVVLKKLGKNTILSTNPMGLGIRLTGEAREAGYRIAIETGDLSATLGLADFYLVPFNNLQRASPDTILTGVDTLDDLARARDSGALYFDGMSPLDMPPLVAKPSINPAHVTVLELIGAVQQEADPQVIEALFKKDVTLSFKLLRYINSPFFGLARRVESVRHACSIIGYQQLFKWLSLLAATAGAAASPALTQSAMIRARLMELLGARVMEKRDQDHLFITGMFSLLDHIMQVPMGQLLERANLPDTVNSALLKGEGRYAHILALAKACEGTPLPEDGNFADIDAKAANLAHLEAIEWAAGIAKSV